MNGKKGGKNFQLTAEQHTSLCEKLEDTLLLGRLRRPSWPSVNGKGPK